MHPDSAVAPAPPGRRRRCPDRGSVVVEAALAIPVLLAVTVLFVWVMSLGATYVRLLDIAQTAARQAARGAPYADGTHEVAVTESAGLIRAVASERVSPPLAGFLDWGLTVSAEAHAVPEWALAYDGDGAGDVP